MTAPSTTDRALMPDYVRIAALFGIVVVNAQYMAYPIDSLGYLDAVPLTVLDRAAIVLVDGFATFKSFGLFSFMFGVGLAFQMRSASRRGQTFGPRYRNRMLGLMLFGVLHGALFYPGDILVIYALMGGLLYLMRDWSVRALTRMAVAILGIFSLLIGGLSLLPEPETLAFLDGESSIMTGGTFWQVIALRAENFAYVFTALLIGQAPIALGWFCLGLAAVKAGLIDQPQHRLWWVARRFCLVPGVVLGVVAALLMQRGDVAVGEALMVMSAPLSTLGYLGVLAHLAHPLGLLSDRLRKAGGASLTIYLGQSIVLSTIFASYGLGLWNALGPLAVLFIAIVVTALLIWAMYLWLSRARLGPFEWVLRRITTLGQTAVAPSKTGLNP